VTARVIEPHKRSLMEWQDYSDITTLEWKFAPVAVDTGSSASPSRGFTGEADAFVKYVTTSTPGFTWTLAGLKALLEHNIRLNLAADRVPNGPLDPYPDTNGMSPSD
jgi:hypothetical protein